MRASLSEEAVIGILKDTGLTRMQLAKKYQGPPDTISRIRNGRRYRHIAPEIPRIPLGHQFERLSQETVNTILASPEPASQLALSMGISKTTICNIRNGLIYKQEVREFFKTIRPERSCSTCVFYDGHTERTRHKGKRVTHFCNLSIPEIQTARATRFANECSCYMEAT